MYLRRPAKLRLLKKKYFIDLWGQYKKKKKFRQRHFQRSLLWFSRVVDIEMYPVLKSRRYIRNLRRWLRRKRKGLPIGPRPTFNRRRYKRNKRRTGLRKKSTNYRKFQKYSKKTYKKRKLEHSRLILTFFKFYLYKYHVFRRKIKRKLPNIMLKHYRIKTIRRWRNTWSRKITNANTTRYRIKPEEFRRVYLRIGRPRRLEIVRQQYYYGFRSAKLFQLFFKTYEVGYNSASCFTLGLEGLLSNLLFRVNLVSTIRGAHLLVRLRAVQLNGRVVKNPHKCLKVGDKFGILPRYVKCVYKTFRKTLRRRLLKINAPNYLEYDYRLMFFFVWRRPTVHEQLFLHQAPYKRTLITKIGSLKN